jgi:hypothetical protein
MNLEYFQCKSSLVIKSKDKMTFEGYASVFGNMDDGGDVMQGGAFTKTIQENMHRIKVLYMHQLYSVIGRPLRLQEDSKGLEFEAKISNTILGKDVMTLIDDKVITEMSIGYQKVKSDYDEVREARILKEVKLWEISPVTWGMNDMAGIKGLAFMSEYDNIKSEMKRLEALISKAGIKTTLDNEPLNGEIDPDIIQSILDKY